METIKNIYVLIGLVLKTALEIKTNMILEFRFKNIICYKCYLNSYV